MTPSLRSRIICGVVTVIPALWVSSGTGVALQSGGGGLMSITDEIALGEQAQAQIKKRVPELTDAMTSAYVRTVGRQLAMRASGPRYPYTVSIANYAELNAFALPGGKVWITRGMIEAAVNEAQLAGVIAHEIAHIGNRDAAGAFNQRLVARGLSGMPGAPLRGDGPVPSIARVMAEGYRLQFSAEDEQGADAAAVGIMRRAGWDPSGIAEFIEIVRKADERDPVIVAAFLLTHPFSDARVERLTTLVKNAPGGARDSDEFRRIHARVLRMPAARPMPRSGV